MKNVAVLLLASMALVGPALAGDHAVKAYVKKDGTYVAPAMATNPNPTKLDNYSTKGNVNPYTAKEGTVDPYAVKPIAPYKPLK